MSAPLLLGIDVGTGGAKAMLVDEAGAVVAVAQESYPLSTPKPLWAEQNPDDWWRATLAAIARVLEGNDAGRVAGIGLAGQMHGLVLLDADGRPVRPAILWNDQRTGAQCDELHRRLGRERVVELTGNVVLPGFTAPKVMWVREHEPEAYARAARMLLPKDDVRRRLTGGFDIDVADASGTALLDVGKRTWSDAMIEAAGVPRAWLPDVHECADVVGRVTAEAARATGLREGTPVVAGAGDQAAQAIGTGIVRAGEGSVTVGTSGVVFVATEGFTFEPAGRLHAFCHAARDRWHVMGVMLSAGGSLAWYRDVVAGGADYETILAGAANAPPACEGLVFLPYLTGERTPHPDPDARGAFVGLTIRHRADHLARAVVEGITFGLRDCLELVRDLGVAPTRLRASGGGATSAWWRQIMADILDVEIATVQRAEGAAFGAALLAGVGSGVFESVESAVERTVREEDVAAPREPGAYVEAYARYRQLYPALCE